MEREGRCKQITCARSVSATLGLPHSQLMYPPCSHSSGSRLLHWEPSEAGPGLHAPPRSKLLRFRHSGSPQRCRLSWACILCPSQIRAAQVMRCLVSVFAAIYHLPRPCCSVFWCTTGTPSQADDNCPEPQEVLVSKEACLQFGRQCLSGAVITPFGSGCLSPEGDGQQQAISAQSFVL